MFLTDDVLTTDLAGSLKKVRAALANYWPLFLTQCHQWAYNEIVSALLARGFTQAQIAAWDRGADFERDLTLYRALVRGAALEDYDLKAVEMLDRRKELCGVLVANGGQWQRPKDTPGTVGSGSFDTSGDLYSLDPDDPRRGEPTRW